MKKSKMASLILAGLMSIAALSGCGNSANSVNSNSDGKNNSTASTGELRIATQPSPFAASIFVAKEKGFLDKELKKYNVKVKWTSFEAGPPMNEAFASGAEDIGVMGDVPIILAKSSGQKTVIFAGASYGEKTLALVVKPDSSIKSGEDLKGKKVAFVKGSYGHHLLDLILSKSSLSFNDIEPINLPVADINNAVATKQVDAGVVWEPSLTSGVNNKQVRILIDGTGIKRNNVFYIANEDFAKKNPDIVKAYIKALKEAADYIKSDPEEAAKAVQPDIKELKTAERFCKKQNLSKTDVDIDKLVDTQYLKNSGLIK